MLAPVEMVGCHHQAAGTTHRDAAIRIARVSALVRDVPCSFRSVSQPSTFDDVDHLVGVDILIVFVFIPVVDLLSRSEASDPVFEWPALLGHQTHLALAAHLVAVLFEAFNQLVNRHVCSPWCLGLVGVGEVAGQVGLCVEVESAVPIEDRLLIFQSLQPEFGDPALGQFVLFAFGVFWKHQTVEAVSGDRAGRGLLDHSLTITARAAIRSSSERRNSTSFTIGSPD